MATFISTSSTIILPVELSSFSGHCNNGSTVLEWTTTSEMNNDYFSIERSDDGNSWQPAGTIKTAGNSSINQNYSFTVGETTSEISYFRLKETDLDGHFKYFNTIRVENCKKDILSIQIYSNPTNGTSLSGRVNGMANEVYSIVVYDYFGKIVSHSSSGQSEFRINFPHILPMVLIMQGFIRPMS